MIVNQRPREAYRKPLIALDLSDVSGSVLDMALRLLHRENALWVVHAYEVPFEARLVHTFSAEGMAEYRGEYRSRAVGELTEQLGSIAYLGVRWRLIVRQGDPRDVIIREVTNRGADLVALGTHGRSGVARALLGSVAEHVVQSAPCDILISRPKEFRFELP